MCGGEVMVGWTAIDYLCWIDGAKSVSEAYQQARLRQQRKVQAKSVLLRYTTGVNLTTVNEASYSSHLQNRG